MNCKEGDLAVIVRSDFGHGGKIVRCLKPHISLVWRSGRRGIASSPQEVFCWQIDTPLLKKGKMHNIMNDECLRPIRDQPGADETLSWKDVPQEVAA